MEITQVIKERINSGKSIDASKLITVVKNYDVISFDIFDTLLKRNVARPTDVFTYIGQKMNLLDFVKKRMQAEKKARYKFGKNEITLQDIYNEYGQDYSNIELLAEAELLIVNDDMRLVFEYCIKNKRVVLTSDMYLPEKFLDKILHREGIIGYEKMYISSTVNKTKSSGELFDYVIKDLCIEKNQLLHIGDNIKSDYKVPREKGIHSIHIPSFINKSLYRIKKKYY